MAVGSSFQCVGHLTLAAGQQHGDRAQVTAVELGSDGEPVADPRTVGDEDQFHAATEEPGLRITKRDQQSGAEADRVGDPVVFEPGETRPLDMPVTNTGDLALHDVRVTDRTVTGEPMLAFSCRFPGETSWTDAEDGTVTWDASVPGSGPTSTWKPGVTFHCRGELMLQAGDDPHASTVRVTATSPAGNPLTDENPFHAVVATVPAIDIVEYDGRFPAPANPVDGHDPVNGVHQGPTSGSWQPSVDADTAKDAATYSGEATPRAVQVLVTNTGTAPLESVRVRSVTSTGSPLTGLSCDFSRAAKGAPTSGTSWHGRFAAGAAFPCSATLKMEPGSVHADTASVRAQAVPGGRTVSDEDQFRASAATVAAPVPPVVELPSTGGPNAWLGILGVLLVGAGVGLTRWRISTGRHRG